jgi:serine protease Do
MMNGIVIRLAGIEHPATRIFHQEVITIGTATDSDVNFKSGNSGLPDESLILTLRLRDGAYRISTLHPVAEVTRDGETVAIGDAIQDGDTLYFGTTGIRVRFFALTGTPYDSLLFETAALASVDQAEPIMDTARGRRGLPRTDVAIVFVKQLLRELAAEIPRRILYVGAGVIAAIILTIIGSNILNYFVGSRNTKAIGELGEKLREIDKLRSEIQLAREEAAIIRVSLSLPEKVVNSYGRGVCLIYGTYTFVDPRVGRDVRFKEPTAMENPIGPDGSVNLSVDGNGRVYEVEFTGTGFLVDKDLILTNRHVILAWEADELAGIIKMRGFEPRLKELLAYFPQARQPFTLRVVQISKDPGPDVALCSFTRREADLPVLPLDESGESIASGQPVVLIGYPAGLEGLVARVDERGRAGSRNYGNLSYRTQLNELAAHGKIRPQSTQGHISDIGPQLVYDARTDEGGSGGPVFGANGKVIGINQAVLLNSQATTNFGVPIRFGIELIKKHQQQQPIN